MAEVGLNAEVRTGTGKGVARKLRAQGKVPAVLYGRGSDSIALTVDARALSHSLATDAGSNVLIDLAVGGDSHLTMARSIERDPLRGSIIHVDFLKIARDQKIAVDVPIHLDGDSRGVKEGGLIEHHLWQLHVECLPGNVPERIHVDITNVGVGDSLHVSDIAAPDGVTILSGEDELVVACVVPQAPSLEPEGVEVPAEGEAAEGAAAPAEGGEAEGGGQEA